MVEGINLFRDKFKDYTDCYTVIGGTACDILMSEAELDFRRTKDLDVILIFEDRYEEFASIFWEFIIEGNYRCGWKNSQEMHFYRFTEPDSGYPIQIELFSRKLEYHFDIPGDIVPIHIDEKTASLSAILLDEAYYDFMIKGRKNIDGISILSAPYIIPFKMVAWIDLKRRKELGESIEQRNIKKHKNDVFRLLQIVEVGTHIDTSERIKTDIQAFIDGMNGEEIDSKQLGLPYDKSQALVILRELYL